MDEMTHGKKYLFYLPESSSGYGYTSKAFIFSIRNIRGLKPFKIMVKQPQYAIYKQSNYGLTFGYNYQLYIADNANVGTPSHTKFDRYSSRYYSSIPGSGWNPSIVLAGNQNFQIADWEVFYVV